MTGSFRQKEVIRYSLLFASTLTAILVIFHDTFKIPAHGVYLFALLVGARFIIVSFAIVFIDTFISRYYPGPGTSRKRILKYASGYLFAIILFICTDHLESLILALSGPKTFRGRLGNILFESLMNGSIVFVMQGFVLLRLEKTNIEIENSRLRAANLESVNLLLKQQIQPHFLFNALSMIKSIYKTDIQAGEAYLTHLVHFLRASLTSTSTGIWTLANEIKLCDDYLEMQRVRFQDGLRCLIDIPETVLQRGLLPSFSLQSLIENAIKHNEVSSIDPLVINVYYQEGRIITENNFQPRRQKDHPSGKGLTNLIERYKILSGDEVIIRQDNQNFSVSIKVL